MVGKFGKAIVLVLTLALLTTGVVYAQDETNHERNNHIGEVRSVNPEADSFVLHCRNGEDLEFFVTDRTNFRSRNGAIGGLEDLSVGMNALVSAIQDREGHLIALLVAAVEAGDLPELQRVRGIFSSINMEEGSFQLKMEDGEVQEFDVGYRTRYRSRDGSIHGLSDIEPGMLGSVVAILREEQAPLALWVGVGGFAEQRERFTVIGEIINVVPGQGTFELESRNGDILLFSVIERTKFRSRDGSMDDIHDLKKGMHALVVGLRNGEDGQIALGIAAGYPDDVRALSEWDVRALGRISSINDQSFTIESRNQGSLTFFVNSSTIYKSRNGSVGDFEDLQVGMIAAVIAEEMGDGTYNAIIVGAGFRYLSTCGQIDGLIDSIKNLLLLSRRFFSHC
jgi:hypothetical protein